MALAAASATSNGLDSLCRKRVCTCIRTYTGESGGWFVDGDSIWLRAAPDLCLNEAPAFGHFFGSMAARWPVRGKSQRANREHWALHYLRFPGEAAFLASPMAFPPTSRALEMWVHDLETLVLLDERIARYETSLQSLTGIVQKQGLEGGIVDKIVCSPLCRFLGDKVLEASRLDECNLEHLKDSLCVNNYWQSSKNIEAEAHAEIANRLVMKGCAWHIVLAKALPPPRVRLRGKRCRCAPNAAASPDGVGASSSEDAAGPDPAGAAASSDLAAASPDLAAASADPRASATSDSLRLIETRDVGVGESPGGTPMAVKPPGLRDACVGHHSESTMSTPSYDVRAYVGTYVRTHVRTYVSTVRT